MLPVVPSLCCDLSLHDYIVWPHSQEWRLFRVAHQWRDGLLIRGCAPDVLREYYLPSTQWVARVNVLSGAEVRAGRALSVEDVLQDTARMWHSATLSVRLQGPSMGSMVPDGACLTVVPAGLAPLAEGQVIVMAGQKPIWVAHRIQSMERQPWGISQIITKGDALVQRDVPITPERILGRVVRVSFCGRSWHPEARHMRWLCFLRDRGTLWTRRIRRNLPFG